MMYSSLGFAIHKTKSYKSVLPVIVLKPFPVIAKSSELNFFRKIPISEPQHSRILGDLLDPLGSHNQGDVFLRLFFETLGIEYDKNDWWTVTVESERFDIRIATKSRNKIIIIENKSNWAEDQPNQLYRYWYYGIYLPQKKFKNNTNCMKKILYLCPNYQKNISEQTFSRPVDFDKTLPEKVPCKIIEKIYFNKEIIKWLFECMNAMKDKDNPELELYYFIKQYYDFWRC